MRSVYYLLSRLRLFFGFKTVLFALAILIGLLYGAFSSFSREKSAQKSPRLFQKGDRWLAVGDSITQAGWYHAYIYLYYATRFPENRFELFNRGIDGTTAVHTFARLERDVLVDRPTIATVLLGTNDIWWLTNPGVPLEDQHPPGEYIRKIEMIVDRLRASGSDVVLMTPTLVDEKLEPVQEVPFRKGLSKMAEEVRTLAKRKGVPLVDFRKASIEITERERPKDPRFTLFMDRMHPLQEGHFLLAYEFLRTQRAPAVVSRVVLDLSGNAPKSASTERCQLQNLQGKKSGLSFDLLQEALPFPTSLISHRGLSWAPFEKEMNQEILQVQGLEEGDYDLLIDGKKVGSFSSEVFEMGINLAGNPETPQHRQAVEVGMAVIRKFNADVALRKIAVYEQDVFQRVFEVDSLEVSRDYLAKMVEEEKGVGERKYLLGQIKIYREMKPHQSKSIEESKLAMDQIWKSNLPRMHAYEIRRN